MRTPAGKSVRELSTTLGKSTKDLLEILKSKGIYKTSENEAMSPEEIAILLGRPSPAGGKQITAKKLTIKSTGGIKKDVGVQIKRKKPIFTASQKKHKIEELRALQEKKNRPKKEPASKPVKEKKEVKKEVSTPAPIPTPTPTPTPAPTPASTSTPMPQKLTISKEISTRRAKKRLTQKKSLDKSAIKTQAFHKPVAQAVKTVILGESISVSDLSNELAIKSSDLLASMKVLGFASTDDQMLDQDTALLLIEELGHKAQLLARVEYYKKLDLAWKNENPKTALPPVVSVMGHVDHGKTTLLDSIRQANMAEGEAGGITQHIGAYQVQATKGPITFLDTPGHKAFSAMRSLGSQITNVIVLVVAADDGVNQQTEEVIALAKDNKVPLVVAINKIDKPESDPERISQELMRRDVMPDSFGGDTQFIQISAKNGKNIDKLLEAILLQSELLELQAPDRGPAKGVVVESNIVKAIGVSVTVVITAGNLKVGDCVTCGPAYGKVRIIKNSDGKNIKSAELGMPVQIFGFNHLPTPGSQMVVIEKDSIARDLAAFFVQEKDSSLKLRQDSIDEDEDPFAQLENIPDKVYNLIIKTDVQGSRMAIAQIIDSIEEAKDRIKIVVNKTGPIIESDIKLAKATNAQIIAFNVRAETNAKSLAIKSAIQISHYSIIYQIEDDIIKLLAEDTKLEDKDQVMGIAEVREVFDSTKFGQVAGCVIKDGTVKRSNRIRVLRDNVVVFEGELESLRRFKEDVKEVKTGIECGIAVKKYNDVKAGDTIEVFEKV